MEHKVHHSVWRSLPLFPNPSQSNSVLTIAFLSHKLHFSSILPPWMWSLSTPEPCIQVSLHIQPTCPTLLILLNLKTLIIFEEQHKSWSSSLRNFLQPPVTSSLFLKSLNLGSFPHCEKPRCTPIQNKGKIRLPYILTFMSHRGQKYKWF
jgi:hypothetical protein